MSTNPRERTCRRPHGSRFDGQWGRRKSHFQSKRKSNHRILRMSGHRAQIHGLGGGAARRNRMFYIPASLFGVLCRNARLD